MIAIQLCARPQPAEAICGTAAQNGSRYLVEGDGI